MESPNSLDALGDRTFSFYPPIRNIEHNEWRLRRSEWSEVLVTNVKSGTEVWIPRRMVGQVSSVDEPVMIVGLVRELEYKGGTVWAYERRVLEMPRAVHDAPRPAQPPQPVQHETGAHLAAGRPPSTELRIGRLIGGALLFGILACFIVIAIFRAAPMRPVKITAADQEFLTLTRYDDYFSVVRKLGEPQSSRWKSEAGELQYQALWYPQRSYFVILLGTDRKSMKYIGALDRNWRVAHYVDLPNGANTSSMLRSLERF